MQAPEAIENRGHALRAVQALSLSRTRDAQATLRCGADADNSRSEKEKSKVSKEIIVEELRHKLRSIYMGLTSDYIGGRREAS